MRLNGGVIIIGSLLWQHDLCPAKSDNVRRSWRNTALILDEKILVKLPIRYGRYSKGSIYTMVFSTRCEKTQRLGTGHVIPFKNNSIEHLDVLICEARMMSKAEGMEGKFIGGTNQIWATMGILINKHKVDVRRLPDDVLNRLKELSHDVVSELAEKNKAAQRIYDSYNKFYKQVSAWHEISEKIYFNVR